MNIWIDGSGALLQGQVGRFCVAFENGDTIVEEVGGNATNNEMEYSALLAALRDDRSKDAMIFTDSKLLVGQVTEGWRINADNLRPYLQESKRLLEIQRARLSWIPRDQNRAGRILERVLGRQ